MESREGDRRQFRKERPEGTFSGLHLCLGIVVSERRLEVMRVALGAQCLHNVSMPNVLVRDIPDEVHAALQRRAEERGQSLQQYLAAELARLAERPSVDDLFTRIGRRRGGRVGLRTAAADLADEREGR